MRLLAPASSLPVTERMDVVPVTGLGLEDAAAVKSA